MDVKSERNRLFRAIKKAVERHIELKGLQYVVSMKSEEFGEESFDYDSFTEAVEAYRTLKKNAKNLKDGIERTFTLAIKMEDE